MARLQAPRMVTGQIIVTAGLKVYHFPFRFEIPEGIGITLYVSLWRLQILAKALRRKRFAFIGLNGLCAILTFLNRYVLHNQTYFFFLY